MLLLGVEGFVYFEANKKIAGQTKCTAAQLLQDIIKAIHLSG